MFIPFDTPQYLKDCDSIIVITKGKISEEGCHDELMKANGVYTKLIQTHHSKPDVQRDEEETGEDIEWSEGGGGMSPQR